MLVRSLVLSSILLAGTAVAAPSYFISIDGLNPSLLETLVAHGDLTAPHGLGWLRREGAVVERIMPVVTTLTAPSHVSTITCSPPGKHGVIANNFFRGGERLNGFTSAIATEPLWLAAKRQGKKVLSLAYVGADGSAPERSADYGLGYPDEALVANAQTLSWDLAALAPASGWTRIASDVTPAGELKEASFHLTLNKQTQEARTIHALLLVQGGIVSSVRFDDDKNLANGFLGTLTPGTNPGQRLDLFFVETDATSTTIGYKRRAFVRALRDTEGHFGLYVSKASYNNAYPAAFRERLDAANMVWPDYGVRSDTLNLAEYLDAQAMIDRFLTDVAVTIAPSLNVDIVLFYQPLIDSVEHKLLAALPQPYDPAATDDVSQLFTGAFKIIDENIARLVATTDGRSVIALMGDHGMDPSHKVVNIARLLPDDHAGKIDVLVSGALAMLYDKPGHEGQAAAYGQELQRRLAEVMDGERAALGRAYQREAGREWNYGEASWAYTAGAGFWWQYMPNSEHLLLNPPALGMHGHSTDVAQMATSMMVHAPGLARTVVATGSLIDAVPTFAALIGIEPPLNCEGRALFR